MTVFSVCISVFGCMFLCVCDLPTSVSVYIIDLAYSENHPAELNLMFLKP